MTVLLSRDSELYISTVDTDVEASTALNTTKISILSGFKLTKTSVKDEYSIFRQGTAPDRVSSRSIKDYNLANIEFTTYVKSKLNSGVFESSDKILWDSLTNNGTTSGASSFDVDFLSSNTTIFPDLYIYIKIGEAIFKVGKCFVNAVTINFNINNIVTATWKIKAITFEPITSAPTTFLDRTENAGYLKGKLSTMSFLRTATDYTMALLKGSVTIKNDVTKLSTPIVGQQIAQNLRAVIEKRTVEGSFEVYLRARGKNSLTLLEDMLNSLSTINDLSAIVINLGGDTGKFLEISMPTTVIQLPAINIRDIVSTTIKMFPKESTLGANDDITIKYKN